MKTIFSIFESLNRSELIIEELVKNGITKDQISIITTDTYDNSFDATLNREIEGVASGMLAGILAEVVSINIAEIGEVFIVGPAQALLELNTTATMSENLKKTGFDNKKAEIYEEYIRKDYVIIGITAEDDTTAKAEKIFADNAGLETINLITR
jgi:hypothetical protein